MGYDAPSTIADGAETASDALTLVIVGPGGVRARELPESGRLHLGRAPENEIVVDDPSMSRVHAALIMGPQVLLEDLGSANGTRIQGGTLPASEPRPLAVGEAFNLGATIFVLKRESRAQRTALTTHGYLEARLKEECAARERGPKAPFALIRLGVQGEVDPAELEQLLVADLRIGDVVASYAPLELELLLLDASQARARQIVERIETGLQRLGAKAQVGLALYPLHGLSADALISASALDTPQVDRDSPQIVVEDPAMKALHDLVKRVAQGTISVLLLGETGVGKEEIASALHRHSPRRKNPFLRLNCAALSESLVESELFGHEKGAFTGAETAKQGLMELASGGTLFLDEVGELPLATQAKLLRAIEQQEVLRVGATKPRRIDVRWIAATNRNLPAEVAAGRFRGDLYYRINGVMLEIPPLRDRPNEIAPLANIFLDRAARALGRSPPTLTPGTVALLRGYNWPGNIRELKNTMERAVLLCHGDTVEPVDLPFEKLTVRWPASPRGKSELSPEDQALKDRIAEALELAAGNQTRAAQTLGVSRQTLSKLLTRFGFARPKKGA